jgi:hypothetical protein
MQQQVQKHTCLLSADLLAACLLPACRWSAKKHSSRLQVSEHTEAR